MLALGFPGGPEVLIIVAIGVVVFGAKRLPEVARSFGKSFVEFKRGFRDVEETVDEAKSMAKSASDDIKSAVQKEEEEIKKATA